MIRKLIRSWRMSVEGVFTDQHVEAVEQMSTQMHQTSKTIGAYTLAQEQVNEQRRLGEEQQRMAIEQQTQARQQMAGLFQRSIEGRKR